MFPADGSKWEEFGCVGHPQRDPDDLHLHLSYPRYLDITPCENVTCS